MPDQKDKANFTIYDVRTWEKTNARHILTNISRSADNQAMKFDQLTEYNIRNPFIGKSYIKRGGEAIPKLFSKKSKLSISLNQ